MAFGSWFSCGAPAVLELLRRLVDIDEPAATHFDPGEFPGSTLTHYARRAHTDERAHLFRWDQFEVVLVRGADTNTRVAACPAIRPQSTIPNGLSCSRR